VSVGIANFDHYRTRVLLYVGTPASRVNNLAGHYT